LYSPAREPDNEIIEDPIVHPEQWALAASLQVEHPVHVLQGVITEP